MNEAAMVSEKEIWEQLANPSKTFVELSLYRTQHS